MPIRVLHIVDSLEPEVGSIAISLRGLFQPLAEARISSNVLTARPTSMHIPGADVDSATAGRVTDRIAAADLIHYHCCDRNLVESLGPQIRSAGKPYIVSPLGALSPNPYAKGGWFRRLRRSLQERRFYRDAACVTVLAEKERQHVIRRGLVGENRIRVLPYGIDIDDAKPARIASANGGSTDRRHMLMLCPIDPIEGVVPMLRAVAELGRDFQGWTVTLAGPEKADWRAQLEAAILRKGFADRVTIVVNPDERQQQVLLAEATFLAAPSFCIRPPVSVLQAIAAGVPVLASDHGLPEGLASHITISEPTRDHLREAARKLIRQALSERTRQAREAFDFAGKNLAWPALVSQFASLYSVVTNA